MNNKKYKAVNAFIFAGSFSIGVMKAGFDLKKVLEISNTQLNENAFYFHKNYPDIPVVLPNEWENNQYLDNLKLENIDIMCCNCPCSSLSTINRNASVEGKNNVHFYRLFNIFEHVQPKAFVIENAPTLIKLGKPILNDLVKKLNHIYDFTIIHDMAGNHDVAMQRMRTMVVGWRKDIFVKHPMIRQEAHEKMTSMMLLNDIIESDVNDAPSKQYNDLNSLYKYSINGLPFITSLAKQYLFNEDKKVSNEILDIIKPTKHYNEFEKIIDKIKTHHNMWDKSPFRPYKDGRFPSFSSVQEYMHPTQNRTLNLKELQRLMNYPDEFDFTDSENECRIPVRQAMAQGVPANFGEWIARNVLRALEGKCEYVNTDNQIVYQDHIKHGISSFSMDEFISLSEVTLSKSFEKLNN